MNCSPKNPALLLLVALAMTLSGCYKPHKQSFNEHAAHDEIVTVYSHGYMCNKGFARFFHTSQSRPNKLCPNAFILGPMIAFNYEDYRNPLLCRLGQDGDIERLHQACKDYQRVILVGTSRGAAAIANYLGTYKPDNIIAAILESPFDTAENVAHNLLNKFNIKDKDGFIKTVRPFLFKNYDPDGIQPIKVAHEIPREIPLLFVCSKSDGLIPYQSTERVYDAVKNAGHERAHLLTCNKGSHGRILWGKDGKKFKDVVHAFYRHYNLPNHKPWALEGFEAFKDCPGFCEN